MTPTSRPEQSASETPPNRPRDLTSRRTVLAGALTGTAAVAGGALLPQWAVGAAAAAPQTPGGAAPGGQLYCGRGRGDATGEPLGAGMNGYAVLKQSARGLRMRQWARAFVFGTDPARPALAHVTVECGLMFNAIYREVQARLRPRVGDLFHDGNLLLTASHTHAAPGGTSGHSMVDLTTLGFRPKTFNFVVDGIVDALVAAVADYGPATLAVGRGRIPGVGANRSRKAFERNPESDKAAFPEGIDDRTITLQVEKDGELTGVLNWYALHATSMGPDARICSTDNKGYAAWLWENERNGEGVRTGMQPGFLAAFAQGASGDITPNLSLEIGDKPEAAQLANTVELGRAQYEGARATVTTGAAGMAGPVDVVWTFVDMSSVEVSGDFTPDGQPHRTWPGMLGAAFAASSQEDGGGLDVALFNEGERGGNPVIRAINHAVVPPEVAAAHAPKDILIPAGLVPGAVQKVCGFHLARIGELFLFTCPIELTVVSGLRIRRVIGDVLGVDPESIVAQGLTNGYAHYATTPEEYENQDYEGGATFFGRWELPAIMQVAHRLAVALRDGTPVEPGARLDDDPTSALPVSPTGQTLVDATRPGQTFGQCLEEPRERYGRGETVSVRFAVANPNHNLRRNDTYVLVERREGDTWMPVADDSSWYTQIVYEHLNPWTDAVVTWEVPESATPGRHRIVYRGDARGLTGRLAPFEGKSREFDLD